MNFEGRLFEHFGKNTVIPEHAENSFNYAYEQIISSSHKKERQITKKKVTENNRKFIALLIAAAITLLCAGAASAYAIAHYNFLSAIWRSDQTEQESELLDSYITDGNISAELMGYIFNIEKYMIDENGMGFLRYSVDRADGLPIAYSVNTLGSSDPNGDDEIMFTSNAGGVTLIGAAYYLDDEKQQPASNHTFIDGKLSTETKIYLTDVFTFVDSPIDENLIMSIYLYDEANTQHSTKITLPVARKIPSIEFSDKSGGTRAKISPIGILLYGPDYSLYKLNSLSFTMQDESSCDILSSAKAITIGLNGNKFIIFDNMTEIEKIITVDANGYTLTRELAQTVLFNPDASPKAEPNEFTPSDRTDLIIPSIGENPFHYRRDDGTEVFVLTKETVTNCSEQDIKDFIAFQHGYSSYDKFIEEVGTEYSVKEHLNMAVRPDTLPENCISANEAIEIYLALFEQLFPDTANSISSIVISIGENKAAEDIEEIGCRFEWTITSNTEFLNEVTIDAESGTIVWPHIVGINGEIDPETGEFVRY